MPLRVNYAGVMPIIFAQAILMFPQKILQFAGSAYKSPFLTSLANRHLIEGGGLYMVLYAMMILFFSYFWVATQFNEIQIADDLKKYGGYIPGVRPGQATSDYLHNAMSRITLAGAVFLTLHCHYPDSVEPGLAGAFSRRPVFRGHEHIDSGGRDARHHAPDGIASFDAPLRRFPQEGPSARALLIRWRGG
jgi:preprotein translocase subunit SecY